MVWVGHKCREDGFQDGVLCVARGPVGGKWEERPEDASRDVFGGTAISIKDVAEVNVCEGGGKGGGCAARHRRAEEGSNGVVGKMECWVEAVLALIRAAGIDGVDGGQFDGMEFTTKRRGVGWCGWVDEGAKCGKEWGGMIAVGGG